MHYNQGKTNGNYSHGMHGTPEYRAFRNARNRCLNPKHPQYADYGGRGIKFLFTSFGQFIQHIGLRPSPQHRLDRINNDKSYKVGNVRWVLPLTSTLNRRLLHSCNKTGYRGVSFNERLGKWEVRIRREYIGLFTTALAAAHAYDAAASSLWGNQATLNFPKSL